MMIEVSKLTKQYDRQAVVDNISFTVERGEILGLLGPNGAGKSTTLRMLCGFLPATSGEIFIGGRDIARDSLEIRRRLGYMPENVPLYPEMRVDEYLRFRGELKGLSWPVLRRRLPKVRALCGLERHGRMSIAKLSKGYRQRVGLADALLHDPELLILDEPTIGLDPNQIRQVRELIVELGRRHTVLLSTHMLAEVDAVCKRVLIMNCGHIVAADTPRGLRELIKYRPVTAEIQADQKELQGELELLLPGVNSFRTEPLEDGWVRCEIQATGDVRIELSRLAAGHNWPVRELSTKDSSLEDVFAHLTGVA